MKNLTKVGAVFTLGLFALGSFFINKVEAQEGCGVIDYGEDFIDPIIDCINPFAKTHDETGFTIEDRVVENGANIVVGEDGTDNYGFAGETYFGRQNFFIYKHDGLNYRAVNTDFSYPSEEAITAKISEYFNGNQVYIHQYKEIYFASRKYDYFYLNSQPIFDVQLNRYIRDVYEEMEYYLESTIWTPRSVLLPGTYTLVRTDTDEGGAVSQRNTFEVILDWLIPKAYAYYNVHTVTFTLLAKEPVPSVLFLPGIMGSNLYEESEECNFFGGADEVKRWVSLYDCDVERLVMDENGVSINNLYTKTEDGVVEDVFLVSNLYDSFIEELAELKEEDKIADYRAIPYDWRLRLSDILKTVNTGGRITLDNNSSYQDGYIYKSLESLVDASPNEKVVLVGHSNGGLVIKTLLATMKAENDPLLDSIEKVVLVAVPQTGTPEAVVGMLHGVEIGLAGVAVDQIQSRQLINTAPFGYHLLPQEDYFEMVDTPVITIESGTSTDAWRGQFGAEIDTLIELKYFLEKESGRSTPVWEDTHIPATAYSSLINYAKSAHGFMQDWKPADTLVYEVAGTGVDTPSNITYFTDTKCARGDVLINGTVVCGETSAKFGYRINTVIDGDGTVVTSSALAVPLSQRSEKWYADLEKYNRDNIDRKHKNIFEVEGVRSLVSGIVSSSTLGGYRFLSKTEPAFEGEDRLVYRLHSPLDLYVVLYDGEVVGSSTPYLRGVEYRRYGELQQLSIPEGETGYEIRLSGVAAGSFTLDIDSYEDDELLDRQTYSAIPSSTSTQVSLKVEEDEEVVLEIDYQGDGVFEATVLPGLAVIVPVLSPATTTPDLPESRNTSSGTKVGVRGLPSAPSGVLSGGQVVTFTQQELMLQLIALLTQYRDLLIKLKVQ